MKKIILAAIIAIFSISVSNLAWSASNPKLSPSVSITISENTDLTDIGYHLITEYGAVCDGNSANASANVTAIQEAIDAAEVDGKAVLHPGGSCRTNAALVVSDANVKMLCASNAGINSQGIVLPGCMIESTLTTGTSALLELNQSTSPYVNNFQIDGWAFDCNDSTTSGRHAIVMKNGTNYVGAVMTNLQFNDCTGKAFFYEDGTYTEGFYVANWRGTDMGGAFGGILQTVSAQTAGTNNIFENVQFQGFNANHNEEFVAHIGEWRATTFRSFVMQGNNLGPQFLSIYTAANQTTNVFQNFHCEITNNGAKFGIYMAPYGDQFTGNGDGSAYGRLIVNGFSCQLPISLSNHSVQLDITNWGGGDETDIRYYLDESRVTNPNRFSYGNVNMFSSSNNIFVPKSYWGRYNLTMQTNGKGIGLIHSRNRKIISFDGTHFPFIKSGATGRYFYDTDDASLEMFSTSQIDTWGMYNDAEAGRVFGVTGTGNNVPPLVVKLTLPNDGNSETGTCDAAGNTIDITGHDFSDNDMVRFTTDGTVCAGLELDRHYWVDNATTDDFQLTLCYDGCGVVDITGAGTGTHTFVRPHSHFGTQFYAAIKAKAVTTSTSGNFALTYTDGLQGDGSPAVSLPVGRYGTLSQNDFKNIWFEDFVTTVLDVDDPSNVNFQRIRQLSGGNAPVTLYIANWEVGYGAESVADQSGWNGTVAPVTLYCEDTAPTVGDYIRGDMCINRDVGGTNNIPYYINTTAGSPGTWTAAPVVVP